MTKDQLFTEMEQRFSVTPDYPWLKYPSYATFRHTHHAKWFCLFMEIPADKLGLNLNDNPPVEVINVKARPEEIGNLRTIKGIYPAYHMNKEHWLSINLNECDENMIWQLIEESFKLTF